MGHYYVMITILLILLQYFEPSSALPLCTDTRAPFVSNHTLQFCSGNGTTCCSDADDLQLKNQFELMNVTDSACASLLKSILCARCDQFSAQLFRVDTVPRQVPVLCNALVSNSSTQSSQATSNFCSKVWSTCRDVSIENSPFTASLKGSAGGVGRNSSSTKLTDVWQSQAEFCNAFGGASEDGLECYAGKPVALNSTGTPVPPSGMCLEKIGSGSYLSMVAHPDGSDRAFFSNQQGKIWLATIPQQGSGGTLLLDEADPFLDLTDDVHFDTEFGMLGVAFHPKFTENSRFFVSFNCDKGKWAGCVGRCACNSDVNCDPAKLGSSKGQPCQYHSVIAEFTANGTASLPSLAKDANPSEVRRIFTMGLPFTGHHGGQILFGPKDGYLYFMMGDGGGVGDPFNFAQNKKSLLGKIMRLDIDNMPGANEVSQFDLWGNYSIPKDNPYTDDKDLQKEIWALGLRNPWRCSFDSARTSYFVCGDVGQDQYEEVNLITKGGNYGWHMYEGPYVYNSSGGNTSLDAMRPIFPVMGYKHSEVNSNQGSASITGGYFYRSTTDPCMNGKYVFADLYAGSIWAGTENPTDSGNFSSSKIPFTCAPDSPLNCTFTTPGNSLPSLTYIFSFGEDNHRDVYLLTNSGVYRVVRPSRCSYACAVDRGSVDDASGRPAASSMPSTASILHGSHAILLLVLICFA